MKKIIITKMEEIVYFCLRVRLKLWKRIEKEKQNKCEKGLFFFEKTILKKINLLSYTSKNSNINNKKNYIYEEGKEI